MGVFLRDYGSYFVFMQASQETALMVAARMGNVGIVRKLIQYGANVNLTNKVTGLVW